MQQVKGEEIILCYNYCDENVYLMTTKTCASYKVKLLKLELRDQKYNSTYLCS